MPVASLEGQTNAWTITTAQTDVTNAIGTAHLLIDSTLHRRQGRR